MRPGAPFVASLLLVESLHAFRGLIVREPSSTSRIDKIFYTRSAFPLDPVFRGVPSTQLEKFFAVSAHLTGLGPATTKHLLGPKPAADPGSGGPGPFFLTLSGLPFLG